MYSWQPVGEMTRMRFGHAVVNVGGRIIALGGKERNPEVVLDSAEEFHLGNRSWTAMKGADRSEGQLWICPRSSFSHSRMCHTLTL